MPALTNKEILLRLKTVPNWSKRAKTIHRVFEFAGFLDSIAFVNRIAKADPADLPEALKQRDQTPRQRKPLEKFVFTGQRGRPSPLLRTIDS